MVGEKPSLRVLLRSAADEARDALSRAPERAIVASPFLTSPTAISIIRRADSRTAVVLTTFDVEAFLSRASSIRTVRRLLEMGYDVRAMDGLHAKIVLTERVALIGSQNLTVNGTRNFEATAVIEDKATLADIRAQLVGWLDKARTITMEMVADVERLLPPLRRRATDMEGSVSKAKLSLREAERVREQRREETERREREASARRRQEEEQRIAAALAFDALQEAVAAAESSLDAARLKLQHIDLPEQKSYWTLLADAGADLRVWRFGNWYGAQPALTRRFRYLLIAPHTGRLVDKP